MVILQTNRLFFLLLSFFLRGGSAGCVVVFCLGYVEGSLGGFKTIACSFFTGFTFACIGISGCCFGCGCFKTHVKCFGIGFIFCVESLQVSLCLCCFSFVFG